MAQHTHDVYDTGKHFEINGTSRFIKETSSTKLVLVQGDHKSEVITFQMPRYIDGHDMLLCNKVRVHYINIDTKTNDKSADLYEVTDLALCEECEDVLIFTWTVEAPATKYYGTLSFLVKFECTEGENILYQWNTAKYVSISVLDGIDNSEEFVDKYSNVLEEWYNKLTRGADSIEELIESKTEQIIEKLPTDFTNLNIQVGELSQDVKDNQRQIDAERERIDQLTTLEAGSTTGDAELIDARVDYTGNVWSNVGNHMRGVSRQLQKHIDSFSGTIEVTTEEPTRKKTAMVINPVAEEVQLYTAEEIDQMFYEQASYNPNLLINGDFQVWQRGNTFNLTAQLKHTYTADRWCIFTNVGITANISKVDNGLKFSCTNNNNALAQILGKPLVVGADYTLSAMIDGVVHVLPIIGGTSANAEGVNDGNRLAYDASYGNGRVMIKPSGVTTISWVKLERGKVATPIVSKDYGEELRVCQRYCYVIRNSKHIGFHDSGKVYLHDSWVANNMRDDKSIINSGVNSLKCYYGKTSGASNSGVIVNGIYMSDNSICFNLTNYSDLTNPAVAFEFKNADSCVIIDAEIY